MNCYNFDAYFRQWTAHTGQRWWREKLSCMNCYTFPDYFRLWTAYTGQCWWRESLVAWIVAILLIILGCGQHVGSSAGGEKALLHELLQFCWLFQAVDSTYGAVLVDRKLCCMNCDNFADYFRLWTAHTGQCWWGAVLPVLLRSQFYIS